MLRDAYRVRGHEALLFSSRALYGSPPAEADITCFGSTSALRQILRVGNFSAVRQLHHLVTRFRPDVVHVRMMSTQLSPLIIPVLRDYPTIYHACWHEVICPNGLKMLPDLQPCNYRAGVECWRQGCVSAASWTGLMLQLRLMRRWRPVLDRIVANSHYLREQLAGEGWSPVEVIWNGVPDNGPRASLGDVPTIGFAGRLTEEKGTTALFEAFAVVREKVNNARLLVVGDGPDRHRLDDLCNQRGIMDSVQFTGHLSQSDAVDILEQAWVQVVPSICQESFGLVAAEAQMRGTAVIATSRGALPEIIADRQTGRLVEADSAIALAEELNQYLTDKQRCEDEGKAARIRALELFPLDQCVANFLELYTEVIAEYHPDAPLEAES